MKKLQINIYNKRKKNLNTTQQIMLLENLNSLLKSGFTLFECFNFINLYFKYKDKTLSNKIIEGIKNGMACDDVLNLIGYPQSIITQIYFAQKFGNIEDSLQESINYLKTNLNAKQQILKSIQYPIVLIVIFIGMITILNYTVLPQFEQLYATMDVNLSFFQKFLTKTISTLPTFIMITSILLLFIFLTSLIIQANISIAKKIKFLTQIPIFKGYYKLFKTYQIASELSLFYKNGITLQNIVSIYISQKNNSFLNYLGELLLQNSNNGISLAESLRAQHCFQDDLIKFIQQGEKSGKLDVELKLYSQILIQRIQNKALKHSKIIQPVVFLFLGFFIISLYLVIMLPMFQLMQNIK
ncbi:putative type II secretion system protein [Staphylococcus petrasii]|uniref:Putative type II secretion system protein n=2 Tax=Staphylococcus petrasii TaxID=1276936 RepID=A0A380G0W4_9STAP|nr:competence type IV pilus assembly protein ComGB [Staphylococcus petrasii]TGE13316.1 type II secretion system F family protein [Staphylococcus petrasii]TGE19400.1 type II secretion system F family protein [Staphylococcus petrasii]SUM44136.1 putative type II secretion system protein [Staphylococcus petrasii]